MPVRPPRNSPWPLVLFLTAAIALLAVIDLVRPGSLLRSYWTDQPSVTRTPAQSAREGLERTRPRRPTPPPR